MPGNRAEDRVVELLRIGPDRLRRKRRDVSKECIVILDFNIQSGQRLPVGFRQLARIQIQDGLLQGHAAIRQNNRIVQHIVAAQIEQPRQIIERRDQQRLSAFLSHVRAEFIQLLRRRPAAVTFF